MKNLKYLLIAFIIIINACGDDTNKGNSDETIDLKETIEPKEKTVDELWAETKAADTKNAYEDFIDKFSSSTYADTAQIILPYFNKTYNFKFEKKVDYSIMTDEIELIFKDDNTVTGTSDGGSEGDYNVGWGGEYKGERNFLTLKLQYLETEFSDSDEKFDWTEKTFNITKQGLVLDGDLYKPVISNDILKEDIIKKHSEIEKGEGYTEENQDIECNVDNRMPPVKIKKKDGEIRYIKVSYSDGHSDWNHIYYYWENQLIYVYIYNYTGEEYEIGGITERHDDYEIKYYYNSGKCILSVTKKNFEKKNTVFNDETADEELENGKKYLKWAKINNWDKYCE